MVASFIDQSKSTQSGFFLNNYDELVRRWKDLLASDERKVIVLGVSFALLDLAEQFPFDARGSIVMETGGMKGRRKEMIRAELHKKFMDAWKLATIHSEYGMTELSSQAYSSGRGIFKCRPGMKFVLRDITDPFASVPKGTIGKICIIDLANKDTCCFLETSDLGREVSDGYFEILGREDGSESRGCNLMVF
jgi:acyl-CoA synthetase (AMP-forming)/AMP-acid ligase II